MFFIPASSSGAGGPARSTSLSDQDIARAVPGAAKALAKHLSTTSANIARINAQAQAELEHIEAERLRKMAEAERKKKEGLEDIEAGMKQMAAADRKKAEAERKMEVAERKMAAANEDKKAAADKRAAAEKLRQKLIILEFCKIFNKTQLPSSEVAAISPLANRTLTIERNSDGRSYPKITSTAVDAIAEYLNEHNNIEECNFSHFGATVEDIIPAIADFLKNCKQIKAVTFHPSILAIARAKLAEAVAVRDIARAPLTVQ